MTVLQQVHWQLTMDYLGHPYYVSGAAIYHALSGRLAPSRHRQLHASHGMFVPGQFGRFPDAHSQKGTQPNLGASLPPVNRYEDLFLFRQPSQPWLLTARPRDALNTHDIRLQGGHVALTNETIMGRAQDHQQSKQTTSWYVSAYLHADDPAVLPLEEAVLDGLQFGGKRNYGYGTTTLKDTQLVDLESLSYDRLEAGTSFQIRLVTPYVLQSTYPGADDMTVPWWWALDEESQLRRRREKLYEGGTGYDLQIIDHGLVVDYAGDRPVETAKNGILRVGTHAKYGFGELHIEPIDTATKTEN